MVVTSCIRISSKLGEWAFVGRDELCDTAGALNMASLEIEQGRFGHESHELHREQTVIGRYEFCDIVLETTSVSRQHARIVRRAHEFFLEDLNSVNGTFVNRHKVAELTQLHDGDEIHFYKVRCVFRAGDTVVPTESDTDVNAVPENDTRKRPRSDALIPQLDFNHSAKKLHALLGVLQSVGTTLDVDTVLVRILDGLFSAHRKTVGVTGISRRVGLWWCEVFRFSG